MFGRKKAPVQKIPKTMKGPGDLRRGLWRGGVLQIKITNVCSLDCKNCSAGVGIAKAHHSGRSKRLWFMTPDQFREAVRSLRGYKRVIGLFGGNPTLHPAFDEICNIFREEVPDKEQRGLWSNDLRGKGAVCRETFNPAYSNLNVHRDLEAHDEFARDWPEAIAARPDFMARGRNVPSMHGSWWTAMRDVIPNEDDRWELIGNCFVNQTWSAEITVIQGELRAFFCEFAATRAEFADILGEEEVGMPVTPGWWKKPIQAFEKQICHHCHRCGAPLNPRKIEDLGQSPEDYTATNAALFETIPQRASNRVETRAEVEGDSPSTQYLKRDSTVRPEDVPASGPESLGSPPDLS